MLLSPTLTLPFVDVDRKGGNAPKRGGLTARWWFVLVYVALTVGWMVWRWGL